MTDADLARWTDPDVVRAILGAEAESARAPGDGGQAAGETGDVPAVRRLVDPYVSEGILLDKATVTLYEDIQEFCSMKSAMMCQTVS